jgi:hypothetical protein
MENQQKLQQMCHMAMLDLLRQLRDAKPEERNELARRYAVTITETEKVLAYFWAYVMNNAACE